MSDLDLHELLSAYLDDEVTPEERTRVEAWLASSADARRELDELRSLSALLRESAAWHAPADLAATVLQRTVDDPPDVPVSTVPTDCSAPTARRERSDARSWIVTGISLVITAAALLLMLRGLSPVAPNGSGEVTGERLAKADRSPAEEPADQPLAAGRFAAVETDAVRDRDTLAKKSGEATPTTPSGNKDLVARIDGHADAATRAVPAGTPAPAAPPAAVHDAKRTPHLAAGFGGGAPADKALQRELRAADADVVASLGEVELADGLRAGDVLPYLDGAAVVEMTVVDVRRSYGELQLLLSRQGIDVVPSHELAEAGAAPAADGHAAPRPTANAAPRSESVPSESPAPTAAPPRAVAAHDPAAAKEFEKVKDGKGPHLVAVLVQAPEAALAGILEQLEHDELVADLRLLDGTFVAVPERRDQVLALRRSFADEETYRTAFAAPQRAETPIPLAGPTLGAAPAPAGGSSRNGSELKVAGSPTPSADRPGTAPAEGGKHPSAGEPERGSPAKPAAPANRVDDAVGNRALGRAELSRALNQQGAGPESAARNQFGQWLQRRNAVQNALPAKQAADESGDRVAAKGTAPKGPEAAAATATPIVRAPSVRGSASPPSETKPHSEQQVANARSGMAANAFQMPLNEPEPSGELRRRATDSRNVQSRVVEKTDTLRTASAAPKAETLAESQQDRQAERKSRGQNPPVDDPTLVRMIFVLRVSPDAGRNAVPADVPSESPAAKTQPR